MAIEINPDKKVSELLELHPMVLETMVAAGFTPLRVPIIRTMMASTVTLRQACAKHGLEVEPLVRQIQLACTEREESHG